jgi:hypothetical protein
VLYISGAWKKVFSAGRSAVKSGFKDRHESVRKLNLFFNVKQKIRDYVDKLFMIISAMIGK